MCGMPYRIWYVLCGIPSIYVIVVFYYVLLPLSLLLRFFRCVREINNNFFVFYIFLVPAGELSAPKSIILSYCFHSSQYFEFETSSSSIFFFHFFFLYSFACLLFSLIYVSQHWLTLTLHQQQKKYIFFNVAHRDLVYVCLKS